MIKSVTLVLVPGCEADIKLSDLARSGATESFSMKAIDGTELWMLCRVHGPSTTLGDNGLPANEYILEALQKS